MTFGLVPFPAEAAAAERRSHRAGSDGWEHEHRPTPIRAVCLDIDDTLVDFTSTARQALCDLIGRDDMWPRWQRTTDEHVARVVAGELAYEAMHRERTKAFFADLGALLDDDLVADLERRRCTQLSAGWRLFDDTVPCLDWLRAAGLKLAAVTNASGSHQRVKLERLGISRFFDTVLIAGELGAAKPDPVIFHTACARMGVPVDATMHVGDLLDADAIGARDAGLHGVWLDRAPAPTGHAVETVAGVQTIGTLADLPELLVTEYRTPDLSEPDPADGDPISGADGLWSNISSRH
ncbi:HAD family hydrolase [Actinophytocola sp.]|jgi:putative hydrolase of the HAD superfamily|uniref:HAD family hydrolase n=1 Tax=Actinophytocola sp. TaxID=1872138 RepID=UPI002ED995CC